jgi:FrmR/RcnR family transcriptional regulator, repressor of frmRAB operon
VGHAGYGIPPHPIYNDGVSHTIREKQKLLIRVRRLRGQVEAIERALEEESGCDKVMHLIAGVRGATSSLMAEVMEDHVRDHFIEAKRGSEGSTAEAAEQLIDVLHAYIK